MSLPSSSAIERCSPHRQDLLGFALRRFPGSWNRYMFIGVTMAVAVRFDGRA